jgi:tRNA pseudouridine38-40 synthase
VPDDAHARFSALNRTYNYYIHFNKSPFKIGRSCEVRDVLDIAKMNQAAALLLNHHNFQNFSKTKTDVKTYLCDITYAKWIVEQDRWVFKITANRFLRGMVRIVTGNLIEIGRGNLTAERFQGLLEPNESNALILKKNLAPADGLYLSEVQYPETFGLK